MPEGPRGTVTFVFTDIEGSTRLWREHHDAMADAYARHDALLRAAVSGHGGVIYKVIGDAVQAAFPTAPDAVAAALAAQTALHAEPWPIPEPVRVRMALHTGAVDPDADGDYRSPVLNRLGRLLSAGHGGQVLLSTATAELVRDALPAGAELRDLGEHRLRDLGRPEPIVQVVHPDLPADFPPLRTLHAQTHNLPVHPTPLIGREREVDQLTALLVQPDVRLVTLTGPGGTGKTRLGLQVAAEVADRFADGVWFVDLAPLVDPGLVPSAIAEVLGVREQGERPLDAQLANYLRDKQLVLVLDNLEQLLPGAAPAIADLLAAAPGVTVLVTSRVPLRLRGEREVAVPPLALPRRMPPPTLEQLTQYEAVRLFIDRAEAVTVDFGVTNANAPAVAEICHRLDGLPLAIELAAARVRLFPPEALLARLQNRLPLLTGGARDLPVRQQTLRAAIGWSYDLLSEDEQALFRRLSVFAGGATFEAVEAVAADEVGLDIFTGLERLVEHSLMRQTQAAGEPRFGMLETIREYGLGQLAQAGEAAEAHRRHAGYYLALAEEAESHLKGGAEQGAWSDWLEAEHDNLRAAFGWLQEQNPPLMVRLAGVLALFWWMRGHWSEGLSWLERALADAPKDRSSARVKALWGAGLLAVFLGDTRASVSRMQEALAMARELGDTALIGEALFGLGTAVADEGDVAQGRSLLTEALAVAREAGDLWMTAVILNDTGVVAARQGDLDLAVDLMEESLELSRETRDAVGVVVCLMNLGELALARQNVEQAVVLLSEALNSMGDLKLGDDWMAEALACLGMAAGALGHVEQAARLFGAADSRFEAIGVATVKNLVLPDAFAHAVAFIRAELGNDAYARAHAAGAMLTREEAVGEAMSVQAPKRE